MVWPLWTPLTKSKKALLCWFIPTPSMITVLSLITCTNASGCASSLHKRSEMVWWSWRSVNSYRMRCIADEHCVTKPKYPIIGIISCLCNAGTCLLDRTTPYTYEPSNNARKKEEYMIPYNPPFWKRLQYHHQYICTVTQSCIWSCVFSIHVTYPLAPSTRTLQLISYFDVFGVCLWVLSFNRRTLGKLFVHPSFVSHRITLIGPFDNKHKDYGHQQNTQAR